MKYRKFFAVGLWMLLGCAALSPAIFAQAKSPTQAYLACQASVQKAKTLEEVLPCLSRAYRAMLESQPKKDYPVWLGRMKDTSNIKDLKITKETISGDSATLEGSGTSPKGNAMRGKVSMVKEGGAWKLDEEGWAT